MSAWAEDVMHRRDGPRGKLHCSAYLSFQSGRAGRKAHFEATCSLGLQIIKNSDHWHRDWHEPATLQARLRAGPAQPPNHAGPRRRWRPADRPSHEYRPGPGVAFGYLSHWQAQLGLKLDRDYDGPPGHGD